MKYSTFAIASLLVSLVSAFPEDEAATPVSIHATCSGVDFTALSLSATRLAGTALQDSYNSVSDADDVDDSNLSDLTFRTSGSSGSTTYGKWDGTWGCEMCEKDDAAEVKAWENSFVAALLDSGHEAFRKVKKCQLTLTVSDGDTNESLNADVEIDCGKNLDATKIGAAPATFLAHAVQRTYNQVHSNKDNDDSTLSQVVYTKTPAKSSFWLTGKSRFNPHLTGFWICRFCPKDDDQLVAMSSGDESMVSGAALQAWETKLTDTLRQGPFPVFRKIGQCRIHLKPKPKIGMAANDEAATPVSVHTTCSGVDFTALSLSATSLAGTALQDSYNSVSDGDDVDDSNLSDLTFRTSGSSGSTTYGKWDGTWGCEMCEKDDAAEVKAWENSFVAALLDSGHEAFRKVKKCQLTLTVSDGDTNESPNADVEIDCGKKLDGTKIGVAPATFLAHAVQRTYNQVHSNKDSDDSTLSQVVYTKTPAKSSFWLTGKSRFNPHLTGFWICRFCPKDDDQLVAMSSGDESMVSGAALQAWETKLTDTLRQGPFPVFRKIGQCRIHLKPKPKTVVIDNEGAEPCGIRGNCNVGELANE